MFTQISSLNTHGAPVFPAGFRTNVYLDPEKKNFIHKEESLSNVLHVMANLAAADWHAVLPGGAEISIQSKKDFVLIIAAPGQYAPLGLLVLGLLNVAYKIAGPLEIVEHGVFAGILLDNIPIAHLNILPKPGLASNLTTSSLQPRINLLGSNYSLPSEGKQTNMTIETTSVNPGSPSMVYKKDGWIADPLDFQFRIYYRRLTTQFEDVDLWTAFLTATASAAAWNGDITGASISMYFVELEIATFCLLIFTLKQMQPALAVIARLT